MLTHETSMQVPIFNSLYQNNSNHSYSKKNFEFNNLNGLNFIKPDDTKFPFLKLLKSIRIKNSYFEIILVSLNDELVKQYLNDKISYDLLQKKLLKLIKHPYFTKYYKLTPNNINDVKNMVKKVNLYLNTDTNK
jgi:1-deoxy-D-xylulose 5-phosphate reductoisomerase